MEITEDSITSYHWISFKSNFKKYSFYLNLFLFELISYENKSFHNYFKDYNDLYSYFSIYVKRRKTWNIY
jgi:hypothetical protein